LRILLLDIETAPNEVYVWGLYQQNVAINQIVSSGHILCWAAKWLDEKTMHFDSIHNHRDQKNPFFLMLHSLHRLLDEADAVVTYNGIKFDIPTINRELLKHDFKPPAPYKNIDLLQHVRRKFRFPSNKLDFVIQDLGIGKKTTHEGQPLWNKCMAGNPTAWKKMQRYNENDVTQMEKLYRRVLGWIDQHPNQATHEEGMCCPNCSSVKYQRRGFALTTTQKYARYQCQECGAWFRGNRTTYHAREKATQIPIL
jgi:DNA polymerase elongation subunit (family B)